MKHISTLFLKIAVILMGIPVFAFAIFGLPWLMNHPMQPDYSHILYPAITIICLSVIPYSFALYQAFRLLIYIDKKTAFSTLSVKSLKNITYCAITISSLYVIMMPFMYLLAEKEDAPGLIIIGMIPIFASMVIAVFAAVLQKLLEEAISIKSENDLTV